MHFVDTGLLCHLLGIDTVEMLRRSPFLGAVFEGYVASVILKYQVNRGCRRELFYFRDQQGLEADLVVPAGDPRLVLIEVKASRTVTPGMAAPLLRPALSRIGEGSLALAGVASRAGSR